MTSLHRLFRTAIVAALAAGGLILSPAAAGLSRAADRAEAVTFPAHSAQGADREWTPERMERARPYPLPATDASSARPAVIEAPLPGAEPVFIPGYPGDDAETTEEVPAPALPPQVDGVERGYSYPAPFTRYENFDRYKKYPYRTVGRLFFTQCGEFNGTPGEECWDFSCSAASIGNFAVFTAGHCIHNGYGTSWTNGGYSYNMEFVPAYKNGNAPYGTWTASKVLTTGNWVSSYGGDMRYDYGGAVLYRKDRKKISAVVGNLGFAYNLNVNQHWFNFGYPATGDFTGETMNICAASYAYSDTAYGSPGPSGMGCDMTAGCSGGPWVAGFRGSNYLNGVNSYRRSGFSLEIYSPYFNADANTFYQTLTTTRP